MLRVVTREEPPYVMRCDNCSSTSQLLHNHSSQGYQGFAIDLLDAISQVGARSQLLDHGIMGRRFPDRGLLR